MLKLVIEIPDSGPLTNKATLCQLERVAEKCQTLDEAVKFIRMLCPSLATYKGGSHIAVHPSFRGEFASGSERLAILTEIPAPVATTKTSKKDGEYRVRLFLDGVYQPGGDYFTDDAADAKATAAAMIAKAVPTDKTTEEARVELEDYLQEQGEEVTHG